MDTILLTGGVGYIGSHICLDLVQKGYQVIIVDNLCNSSDEVIDKIASYTKKSSIYFYHEDLRNEDGLDRIFEKHPTISAVIHLAALKSVKESVKKPLEYYDNNVNGTIILLKIMEKYNCKKLIFSSSATVYGQPKKIPVNEDAPTMAESPYGQTKLTVEHLLKNLSSVDWTWKIISLRYFNPIGAHPSRILSEEPQGVPENLVPYLLQVLGGQQKKLTIFGNDYPTNDGTTIRDYIHILDLVSGHIKALEYLKQFEGFNIFNLGTGKGYSVLDVVNCFESIGMKVPYEFGERRQGDIAKVYADVKKAKNVMGWEAKYVLGDMCKDAALAYLHKQKKK